MRGLTDGGLTARVGAVLDARLQHHVDRPIVLALSGGGDSMALLHLTADWARSRGRRLQALTVDHKLSPQSREWSAVAKAAAVSAGAEWRGLDWQGDKPATGVPAAARTARHALIAEVARQAGARVVLFAHTADDIDESDWMRARGATLGALREWSPSPAWPEGRGLMLLRPLLGERRSDLRTWLAERRSGWIEDPANEDQRFGRPRARAALNRVIHGRLPAGEGLNAREPNGRSDLRERVRGSALNGAPRSPSALRFAHRCALRTSRPLPLGEGFEGVGEDLAMTLLCAAGHDRVPRSDRLAALETRLSAGEGITATLAGARVEVDGGRIIIGREAGELRRRRRPPEPLLLEPRRPAVWDGRYEITVLDAGWRVAPALGLLNRLSKADRAVANTSPAWARRALPVLIRDGGDRPVLAWRVGEVRALGPRRLALALGETTQEADLERTIHGETPPPDLFSHHELKDDAADARRRTENRDESA